MLLQPVALFVIFTTPVGADRYSHNHPASQVDKELLLFIVS
jgi:hypothetical protein